MVALILGVAFFINLAIDRGWLGERERAILGVVAGLALLAAGEYFRNRYPVWAQTVAGGGVAVLYLAVYGAFALYGLIPPVVALASFALITLGGVLLSLRHESVGLAVFSIFGGFATPLLLQKELPDERLLLAYVLVLDMGVLALASFRNWRWFTLLAWIGSLILFGFWMEELEPATPLAEIGITAIFLVFAGATIAFHIVRRQAAGMLDLALVTVNAIAYWLISYALLYDDYRPWMGGFTALLAAFYVLLVAGCQLRGEEQPTLRPYVAALAAGFAALAVPLQFEGPWISMAWGVEAVALVGLSIKFRMRELRRFGYLVFIVSAVWLLAVESPGAFRDDLTPFLNLYMLSYAAAIALPALAGYLLHRSRETLEPWERMAIPVAAVWAAIFAAIAVPLQLDGIWVSVAWAVEAAALVWLSFPLRLRQLRWFGYLVFAVSAVRLLSSDTPAALNEDLTPFLNLYMLSYAAAVALPALAGYLLHRFREALAPRERAAIPVAAVWAAVFAAGVGRRLRRHRRACPAGWHLDQHRLGRRSGCAGLAVVPAPPARSSAGSPIWSSPCPAASTASGGRHPRRSPRGPDTVPEPVHAGLRRNHRSARPRRVPSPPFPRGAPATGAGGHSRGCGVGGRLRRCRRARATRWRLDCHCLGRGSGALPGCLQRASAWSCCAGPPTCC